MAACVVSRAEVREMARQRHDERFWRERVEKWDASGLSARDFATREGVRPERLFFWKRRLRASSAMAVAGVSFAKISVKPVTVEPAVDPLEVVTRAGRRAARLAGSSPSRKRVSAKRSAGLYPHDVSVSKSVAGMTSTAITPRARR
jgi:hypothetical protein